MRHLRSSAQRCRRRRREPCRAVTAAAAAAVVCKSQLRQLIKLIRARQNLQRLRIKPTRKIASTFRSKRCERTEASSRGTLYALLSLGLVGNVRFVPVACHAVDRAHFTLQAHNGGKTTALNLRSSATVGQLRTQIDAVVIAVNYPQPLRRAFARNATPAYCDAWYALNRVVRFGADPPSECI